VLSLVVVLNRAFLRIVLLLWGPILQLLKLVDELLFFLNFAQGATVILRDPEESAVDRSFANSEIAPGESGSQSGGCSKDSSGGEKGDRRSLNHID